MGLFGASPQQLNVAAGHVEAAVTYIEGLRKGVGNTVNELVNSGQASHWEGGAAIKYRLHMEKWDKACQDIILDLRLIYDNLRDSSSTYAKAEEEVRQHNANLIESDVNVAGVGANENRVDSLINVKA
ncbi:WXG100 family type VII secretion target [Nonomuraea sp. NPDC005983]|uniref:WXG100 family type VII secretion target n=1 Tax=Nonomuraea sp. NPDC005983 TaxID=3155595 RepID=UPI0033BDD202